MKKSSRQKREKAKRSNEETTVVAGSFVQRATLAHYGTKKKIIKERKKATRGKPTVKAHAGRTR